MTSGGAAALSALAAAAAVGLVVRSPAERRLGSGPAHRGASRAVGPGPMPSVGPGGSLRQRGRRAVQRFGGVRVRSRNRWAAVDLEAVLALLERVSALLRAGLGPRTVWNHLAATVGPARPLCAFVAESLTAGGSAGPALLGASDLLAHNGSGRSSGGAAGLAPAEVLRWLAVATAVSDRTGAPAADCVDRLAAAVRAELAAADERATALAGPRATAQVLGWLPAAGVVLGALVGADPVRVLLLTGPGRFCLLAGLLLWASGRCWSQALVRRAAAAG